MKGSRILISSLVIAATATLIATHGQAQQKKFVIGVSNGFVGSEWRTQMLDNMQAVNKGYMKAGLTADLVIQSADVDVQGQVQQVRNFISQKVDGIIINPNSATALNPVFKEAADAGIKVISVDQEVSAPTVVNVGIDQREWARNKMEWLAKALGGKGNIVIMNGIAGHPANEARVRGEQDVLAKYPNIKVLNNANGDWDHAKAQQVMSSILASQPNIDGVFTQDGMGQGVLRALIAAKPKKMPIVSGEAYVGYMKLWKEIQKTNKNFTSYGLPNPPGVGASGLRVMVSWLSGKAPKDGILKGDAKNTIFVPIPKAVANGTLANTYDLLENQGKEDTYPMDSILTQAATDALFK